MSDAGFVDAGLVADEVVEGMPVCALVAGRRIAVFRLGDELFAVSDFCTHEFASLAEGWVEGDTVVCPLHGARFSIRTGESHSAIAPVDLYRYELCVRAGRVAVKIGAR